MAVHPQYNDVSGFHKTLLGKNYRNVWALPVKMKVFHLETEKGGLKITGTGGGNQTSSLQLVDSTGQEWVLRSVNKTTSRELPKYYNHTIVTSFLQDEVSTSHPFSALCVAPLEDALDIPHSHPSIVYLPDGPNLGKYRKEFGNQVYLFEEHSPLDGSKAIKTEKLQDKLEKDNDNKADQHLLLRARVLDMIIGDWDRHEGQWRWEKESDTTKDLYEPIPRDRDKVFYTTDGVLPSAISVFVPKLPPYKDHIKNISGWNANNISFDLYFLNQLSWEDWEKEIAYVQSKLTDGLLTQAVKLIPAKAYALTGQRITKTLIQRRNNIKQDAFKYYSFLAKTVDIPASDKNEKFTIAELDSGKINVTINKVKKDTVGKVIYQRTFDPEITKEIRLYGLDGKNTFDIGGNEPSPIKVRMIGGNDEDTYHIDSKLDNRGKLFVYDRSDQKNNLPSSSLAHIRTSKDSTINSFDRPVHQSDRFSPLISLGYSPEDGVMLVGGMHAEKHGFKEVPYVSKQELKVSYTLTKQSFIVTYKGDFKKVIGNNDLQVNILERGPKNVNNFFGMGNVGEFVNSGEKTFDYYRNRYDFTNADVRLAHQYGKWQVSAGVVGQYYSSWESNNTTHFFAEYNDTHPELNLFSTKYYTGLVGGVILDTRNNAKFTSKGVMWRTNITGLTALNVNNKTNGAILSTFSFFIPVKDSAIVIADRTGAGTFIGGGEFFQMMNLGGPSLQGYHTSRFIGNSMLYNNLELRMKVCDFNAYLFPSTLGLVLYNDVGRVWLNGESSNVVHEAYGGGIYLTPYHSFILQGVVGRGTEGYLTYYSIGFRF
ncbi:hypothetical protein ACFGVR_12595 [Mucilaginibacter sp. AW1-3]